MNYKLLKTLHHYVGIQACCTKAKFTNAGRFPLAENTNPNGQLLYWRSVVKPTISPFFETQSSFLMIMKASTPTNQSSKCRTDLSVFMQVQL